MEVCPIGFFCFDKNTFMLLIVFIIIVTVYLINTNSYKYNLEKINYNEKKLELDTIKNKLENTNQTINELKTMTNHINNEKHFTTNNLLSGRDNKFALNPKELLEMKKIRDLFSDFRVSKGFNIQKNELEIFKNYRGRWISKKN